MIPDESSTEVIQTGLIMSGFIMATALIQHSNLLLTLFFVALLAANEVLLVRQVSAKHDQTNFLTENLGNLIASIVLKSVMYLAMCWFCKMILNHSTSRKESKVIPLNQKEIPQSPIEPKKSEILEVCSIQPLREQQKAPVQLDMQVSSSMSLSRLSSPSFYQVNYTQSMEAMQDLFNNLNKCAAIFSIKTHKISHKRQASNLKKMMSQGNIHP